MKFKNPLNGYVEKSEYSFFCTLLFGPLYFLVKGIWIHAIVALILARATDGISWIIYPFFAGAIVRKYYLRKGWTLVEN